VHAGYAKRREDLLRGGIELYELKPDAERPKPKDKAEDHTGKFGSSSGVSLHAKTFSIDRERIFVGSFNLDPRSYKLNTELGLVIQSPVLATTLSKAFDTKVATKSYTVKLDQDGHDLIWVEHTPQGDVIYTTDPHTGFWRRFGVGFLGILPIEWLL
jgi:putative cardiolipin synthase